MFEKQSQTAAEGALAIQAKGNVRVGLSYQEARQVALDVYQSNFPQLVAEAAQLARERAEELTDKFLGRLYQENPDALLQATRPDFQNALLNAQKEHACAGDSDLADLLVDLLVDRTRAPLREIKQLVLDEALKTAPKLTEQQLAVLGATFLLKYSRSLSDTWPGVVAWMNEYMAPVLLQAQITPSTTQHLEFTGCLSVNGMVVSQFADVLLDRYSSFFQTGLSEEDVAAGELSEKALKFIGVMAEAPEKRRVAIVSDEVVDMLMDEGSFEVTEAKKLKRLLRLHRKSSGEVREVVLTQMPFMTIAFDLWEFRKICQLSLTSVGIAIGHAFVRKTVKKDFASLDIWIK